MGSEGEMGTQGIGYWRETGIAVAVFAAMILAAVLIEWLTGFDGFRAVGYLIIAAGLGLAAWNSPPSRRDRDLYLKSFAVVLLGTFLAFQH